MGIRDLWLALSPASQSRTLTQVAVTEGFEYQRRHDRCLIIGVDASIWMNEAQLAVKFRPGRGTRAGENPALQILFYRLCWLMTLPIIPVFLFDGSDRPSVKRGTQVKGKPHWLSLPLKKLIEAFAFSWYMAPGEAEADLAELNRRGFIDIAAYYANNAVVPDGLANIHVLRICQARIGPGACSTHPDVSGYTIQISTHDMLREMALKLDDTSRSAIKKSDCTKISFWTPASVLISALPDLVKRFKGRNVMRQYRHTLL